MAKSKMNFIDGYSVLLHAPVPICIFKCKDYILEFANDFYLELLGKDSSIIGKPIFTSFPEFKTQGLKEIIDNVQASGNSFHLNEHCINISRNKKTEECYFNCVYQPLKEKDGSISGTIIIFTEVTEQVLAKKNNLIYQEKLAADLGTAKHEIAFQKVEKRKRADELGIANIELAYQVDEKAKLAEELGIANLELVHQDDERVRLADELIIANKELLFQNKEKEKRAAELFVTNNELIQSEKLLKNSLKEITDYKEALDITAIIAITNQHGIILKANKNFCKISQYTEAELIGSDNRIVNSGYHPKEFMKDLWSIISKGEIWKGEIKNKTKSGTFYWVDTTIIPFLNEDGKPYQYLAIRVDISKRKESEEQLINANKELVLQNSEKEKRAAELFVANYARGLIEASRDPLFTISPNGKITDMNEATLRVTGKSREELINTNFYKYFTEPKKAKKAYEEIFSEGFITDYPLVIKDHKLTDVMFNGSVYKDENGNVVGAVVVARDITEQKRNSTELIESKIFAEVALKKAEASTQIAEEAVKSKQQFLSNMSHEIRTPMNAILGFTKVLLKTDLNTKQFEYLNAIKLSGDALIVLINDILDLAKVDAGKMIFEHTPFKLSLSISAMLHLFETKIQEKNIELIKEYDNRIPEVLVGDPVRLHQIILNLVSNAVKFTSHGSIIVSVKMIEEDEHKVTIEFSVTDTGIGINENNIDKIFDNFQQASSGTSRLYGGTGLGLAIVKQLVEPQGGTVKVKSKLGVGSTFSFTLDYLKTKAKTISDVEIIELDSEIRNIKVLVVEDIALNQLLMRSILEEFEFECDIASNGKIAIEKLKTSLKDKKKQIKQIERLMESL
jgi:PAS domain S-box-containing protein